MGKRDKLRSVRANARKTAKGTINRIIKHLRSDDDPSRNIKCDMSSHPRTSISVDLFGPPAPKSVFQANSTMPMLPVPYHPNMLDGFLTGTRSPVRSKTLTNLATEKLKSASFSEFMDQFDELCSHVHRQLKEDTRRRRQDSGYETDDDIAEDIREYVPVRIKSFKSTQSVTFETPARLQRPADINENTRIPTTVPQGPMTVFRSPTPNLSPGYSFEAGERMETDKSPANHSEPVSDWVKALEDAVRVADLDAPYVLVGIDLEEDNDPKITKGIAALTTLEEGFDTYLTEASPVTGPDSFVRIHGTDFYELPRESLNTACRLYNSSYSGSPAGTATAETDESPNPDKVLEGVEETEPECAVESPDVPFRRLLSSCVEVEPSYTPEVATSIHSEKLRDSEHGIVKGGPDHSELTGIGSKEGALWETSPGKLLCFREGSIVPVEEALRYLDD